MHPLSGTMDTWQDEMENNLPGPYYGVPYLISDPDSSYNTSPDDMSSAVDKSFTISELTSKLCARPQVNWMQAAGARPQTNWMVSQKVNWLQASQGAASKFDSTMFD